MVEGHVGSWWRGMNWLITVCEADTQKSLVDWSIIVVLILIIIMDTPPEIGLSKWSKNNAN